MDLQNFFIHFFRTLYVKDQQIEMAHAIQQKNVRPEMALVVDLAPRALECVAYVSIQNLQIVSIA